MSKIAVSIYDQTGIFVEIPNIYSGGVGTDTVEFTFDDSWEEYDERTVIFYNEPKKSYPVILDDTNIAVIPSEVIDRETKFYFGVIGTKANGEVKTSNILSFRVEKGSLTADTELPYPSKDVWLQILANYEYALNKVNDIDVKVDNSITETDNKLTEMDEKLTEMDQRFIDAGVENKANKDFSNVSDTDFSTKCESVGIPVINKIPVDLTGITNGASLFYKSNNNKIIPILQFQSGTFNGGRYGGTITFPKTFKNIPVVLLFSKERFYQLCVMSITESQFDWKSDIISSNIDWIAYSTEG